MTAKRRRGSVKPYQGNRWVGRISKGRDPIDGKRLQESKYFDTKAEAEKWLTSRLHALDNGEESRRLRDRQTLGEYLVDYFQNDRRARKGKRLSPRTAAVDLELVRLYVIRRAPAIADTPLLNLKTEKLAKLFRLLADGDEQHAALARSTVSRVYRILRSRLEHAVKLGKIRSNPMQVDLIPIDGKPPREHRTLNPDQAQALLSVCPGDRYGPFIATLLWTGLRPGEAAGLLWADVDLAAGALVVRRALVRTVGKWELRETKTGRARRVPIPESLVATLQTHRRTQAAERLAAGSEYSDHGFVFATVFGEPVHIGTVTRLHYKPLLRVAAVKLAGFKPIAKPKPSKSAEYRAALVAEKAQRADAMKTTAFPSLSLYELRHTQATLLLRRGVHPKIVADRLGHSKTSTTLDIYSHVTPDMQDGVLDVLAGDLSQRRQG